MKPPRPPREKSGTKTPQKPRPPRRGSYSQRLIASSVAAARADRAPERSAARGNRPESARGSERATERRPDTVADRASGRNEPKSAPRGGAIRFRTIARRGPELLDAAEAREVRKLRRGKWNGERNHSDLHAASRQSTANGDRRFSTGSKAAGRSRVRPAQSAPGQRAGSPRPGSHGSIGHGPAPAALPVTTEPIRIAKAMARAGLCSRRDAERWIADGRVSVNGKLLTSPAFDVSPRDRVMVDGTPLPAAEPARLWRYHKPKGLVTTHFDPEGRPTVFENLPPGLPRVVSVGRLDYNSEGLLLLTNDGELARHLELPATGWLRRYRVRAYGRLTQADLDQLKDGTTVDGVTYGPIEATLDSVQSGNMWLTMGLREGKNREVRKILGSLGLEVNRLIRVSFGPFQLLDIEPGAAEHVRRRVLADQLGPDVAARFSLNDYTDDETATTTRVVEGRQKVGGTRVSPAEPRKSSRNQPAPGRPMPSNKRIRPRRTDGPRRP